MAGINIVLFLSDYKKLKSEENPRGAEEVEYKLVGRNLNFKGIQTNDAPIEYLFAQAKAKQGYIKRVLCITSYKVITEPADQTQLDRFKGFVRKLSDKYTMPKPEFVIIPYDFDKLSHEKVDYGNKLPVMIYGELSECFKEITEKEEVYIDYTGGLRDISFLMTSIIKFLEFKGLVCGEIVYSNLFEKQLYDIHYIYDIYQMINGVNEFTTTGNARELQKATVNVIGNNLAKKVVENLIAFSNTLSICDIGNLENCVENLIGVIDQLEKSSCEDINSVMLKTLAPTIRQKMYLDKGLDYPRMIRWCAENNMIQQAATIYTDKMPEYYFKNNLVPNYVDINSVNPSPGHNKFETGFYTELYDRAAEGLEVTVLRRSLKNLSVVTDGSMNRSDIVQVLESQKRNETGIILKAYNRIISFINRCYEKDDLTKRDGASYDVYQVLMYRPNNPSSDADDYVTENGSIPPSFKQFWESLNSSNNYWLHQFLYNNESNYHAISTPSRRGTDKTLRKKVFGVQRIKDKSVNIGIDYDSEKTAKIMAYYLAVKIMRNRMNHAGEGVRTRDESETINALNGLSIGIDFSDNMNSYKRILLEGIEEI